MKTFTILSFSVAVLISVGCQKVKPEVFLLVQSGGSSSQSPNASDPKAGRVTLGSDPTVNSAGGYKLKGRVSYIEPANGSAGGYKLTGTVKFE